MTRRREIGRKLDTLTDISGILSAMRGLALMETRILGEFLDTQQRMVAGIETAAADFLAWHPEYRAPDSHRHELWVLAGSEQGFCGDFNETIEAWAVARSRNAGTLERWVSFLPTPERSTPHDQLRPPRKARTISQFSM